MELLAEGKGHYLTVAPDDFREWTAKKTRAMVPKIMSAQEAVARFVQDGDYIVWECNYLQRGPSILLREVIRQRKADLWAGGKFTWVDVALLLAGGCVSRADMGFFMGGPGMTRAILEGKLTVYEYSNLALTARIRAGAMGVPFIPIRSFGGSSGFEHSGAKLIKDPYTGQPTVIVPALNPDVALIHVHQADQHGNARVFGPSITDAESALASRRVIVSAEEIIDTEELRRNPRITVIPYYAVDAVVHAPFGAYPGECGGYYTSDPDHVTEVFDSMSADRLQDYLEKWVYSVSSDEEMLEKRVGGARLQQLVQRATIKQGWRA